MTGIRAISNHIIFKFEDAIKRGESGKVQFDDTTEWGFQMSSYDEGTKRPRWGIVLSVGPDISSDDNINVGDRILIEPLMWTEGIEHSGTTFWKTDVTKVMLVDNQT